ncbi:MAG: phage portal protein [Mesorhizobium sp.]|nr:phage portal protein [Mesorhizobium sp.]
MRISESVKALFGKGAERKAVTLTDPLAAEIFGAMPSIAGPAIGPATAIRVPAVYSAIALVTGAIGSLPAKVFAVDDGAKQAAIHHPAYALVHDWANDWTSAGELRAALTADALLHDAGYAYANRNGEGQVVEFIRLDPMSITAKQDETTGEPFYAQRQSNGRERTFRYQDILRISAPLGISPIKAGKEAIGLASVLERHGAQLFARGARPSAVLSKEGKAGNDGGATVIGRIKAAWRAWQAATRMARSKPSCTRSTLRLVKSETTETLGWSSMNSATSGARCSCPNSTGAVRRSLPRGDAVSAPASASASSSASRTATTRS